MLKNYPPRIFFISCLLFLIATSVKAQKIDNGFLKKSVSGPITGKRNLIECTPVAPMNTCNIIQNNNFTPTDTYDPGNATMAFDPFSLGYVPQWVQSHGTPNIYDPYHPLSTAPPLPATGFAFMANLYVYDPIQQMMVPGSEGIAQKIPALKTGDKYAMSFFKFLSLGNIQPSPPVNEFYIVLMHCSDYNNFNTGVYFIPPFPVNSQIVYCEANVINTSWQQVLGSFTANDNYDMLWVLTKPNDNSQMGFRGVAFAYPEIVNVQTFSAGPEPTPTPPNCVVTIGPKKPNCAVANAVFTWHGPSSQTITAPANQKIQVDASDPLNVGVWTLRMTVPGAQAPAGACITQSTDIFATVNVASCCNRPVVTPGGPIDYYYMWEQGPMIGVKLSSNSLTGNQWYKNGVILPYETQQIITVHQPGNYTVMINGCSSNPVVVNTHPYGPPNLPFSEHIMPVQSPGYYCFNSTDIIKQFDLGPSANYTWNTNPFGSSNPAIQIDPLSYNIHSPNASVIIGNFANTNDPFVQATADLNGIQKVLDYFIVLSPNTELPAPRCRNTNYSVYANWNSSPWTLPGGTKFDYENYDFGANGVIVAPPVYAGLHQVTIPGNNPMSEPLQVRFSDNSYMKYHFYYSWGGCYKRDIPIQIVCGRSEDNITNIAIYPNPATDKITLTSTDAINLIEISDLMNPTLKTIKTKGTKSITINVFDLKPGVYNCKIITDKGIENRKIIIRR